MCYIGRPSVLVTRFETPINQMTIDIAFGRHKGATRWKNNEIEWSEFVDMCRETHRQPYTIKEFKKFPKKQQGYKKDVGSFCSGLLAGGKISSRSISNVMHKQVATLDADNCKPGFWKRFREAYPNTTAFAYTTHGHTPEAPRWRLCVLFDRPAERDEYEPVCRRIADNVGIDFFDHTSYDLNRLMYLPSTPKDGIFLFKEHVGKPLKVDKVLRTYHNYSDVSQWPIGESENEIIRTGIHEQGDPLTKPGVIGAMARTYTMTEILEGELSDCYEPTEDENSWTYVHGTGTAGLKVYDDKFAYSWHSTDPASLKTCNVFDLVRIHRFGKLDNKAEADTPMTKLPSYIAMCDWCLQDKEIVKTMAIERVKSASEDFAAYFESDEGGGEGEKTEWLGHMDSEKDGRFKTTYKNIKLVLQNDPNLKGKIGLNEFSGRLEVRPGGALPWNKSKKARWWSDKDWHGLREYLGNKPYEFTRTPMLEDVVHGSFEQHNKFHPVKDFIESADWDGKKRVDTIFIDYLGAEDTEYTREVTRKALVACVKRIYEPGCKFDNQIVLVGPEGKGKSTILQMLGREWFSDTFNFGMLAGGNGKMAFEALKGNWIIEAPEMTGLKKADDLSAKGFLGSQVDKYRPSHGKEEVSAPRQSVFFGTTNEWDFLRSKDGNRRFWPVVTHFNFEEDDEPFLSVWEDLSVKVVRQIWAEAYQLYLDGENIEKLSKEVAKTAKKIQDMHTERDERADLIAKYLEMPIPDDWATYGTLDKCNYFNAGDYEGEARIERISIAEIWCECLGASRNSMTTTSTKPIHDIMKKFKNWEKGKSRTVIKGYGNQRWYFRKSTKNYRINYQKLPVNLN